MEIIDDLLPTMPEPTSWPYKKWYSVDKVWYYHTEDEGGSPNYDKRFYSMVDPQIRVLCHFLHLKGLETAPSCQGHFYDRSELKKAWNRLKSDERVIRRKGLEVSDSETGDKILFQNKKYQTPWPTFEVFEKEVFVKQRIGYMGIAVPDKLKNISAEIKALDLNSQYATLETADRSNDKHDLFHLIVKAPNEEEQAKEWKRLTDLFFRLLN